MKGKTYDLAIIIHSLKVGGSEKFVLSLSNKLTELGFSILLILLESKNPLLNALDSRVNYVVLTRAYTYDLSISFKIRNVLTKLNIGKVFCVEPYAFFLTKLGFTLFRKKPLFYLSLHHSKPTYWKKRLSDILFLNLFSINDTAIFICKYQEACFRTFYLFKPVRSMVIYNGVDIEYFLPYTMDSNVRNSTLNWRNRLQIFNNPAIVLIGRISPEKGHKYAIMALDYLKRYHFIPAHILFIGDGSEDIKNDLQSLSEQLNVQEYIHFEGTQHDIRPYLAAADLFTLTSISETFSLAALEAMSMGVPCSLTDVGGARELIVDDRLGNLCMPEDPVSIAHSWAKILSEKKDRALIRNWIVDHFGEQQMVLNYIQAIGLDNEYRERIKI